MNSFKIIVPFYNASKFLDRCVSSILTQKYDNFKAIFINDASTDDSWDKLPHTDPRCICINNETRKTALENIHNAIMNYCDKDDVVAIVDGDDALLNKTAISHINSIYEERDCWICYGQFMLSTGGVGFASAYSEKEYENVRKAPFRLSHLRTFKAGLYHKIQKQDETFECMKDVSGDFYRISYDVAIGFPLFELCPFEKVVFNSKPVYLYNFENPISDHIVDQRGQTNTHIEISNKKKFERIYDFQ